MNKLHTVLVFDLDNTLIFRDEAMLNCIESLFDIQLSDSQKKEIKIQDEQGYSNRLDFCESLNDFLELNEEPQFIWNKIKNNIGHFVQLNKDVPQLLSSLQKEYELALFTNGGTINQQNKIKHTNLNSFFPKDKIFISGSIGFKKPDAKAFQIIQDSFDKAAKFCMIGDHWENDILGAINFGWQAIYLNEERKHFNSKNVLQIPSLSKLNEALNELKHE